jgi:hypothetical protein
MTCMATLSETTMRVRRTVPLLGALCLLASGARAQEAAAAVSAVAAVAAAAKPRKRDAGGNATPGEFRLRLSVGEGDLGVLRPRPLHWRVMGKSPRFPPAVLDMLRKDMVLGIRAGAASHRVIAIWCVVAEERVFVRSWSLEPRSWWRTFLEDPRGIITVRGKEIRVRAVQTRSERVKDAVDLAYREKYHTPASLGYVRDLCRARSRNTTTELVPLR